MLEKLKKTLSDKKAKKVQKDQSGFTIIEVMIVLAIAALILVIVFLAVPALQRSSRNSGRDADATNLLAAINSYEGNHGGALPSSAGECSDSGDDLGHNCDVLKDFKAGFYNTSDSTIKIGATPPAAGYYITDASSSAAKRTLTVFYKAKCVTNSGVQVALPSNSSKQIVVAYANEGSDGSSSTVNTRCKEG